MILAITDMTWHSVIICEEIYTTYCMQTSQTADLLFWRLVGCKLLFSESFPSTDDLNDDVLAYTQ